MAMFPCSLKPLGGPQRFTTAEWNIGCFGFTEEQGNAKLFVDRKTVSAQFLERILFVQQHGGFYGLCEA